jgi:hypothetical protein
VDLLALLILAAPVLLWHWLRARHYLCQPCARGYHPRCDHESTYACKCPCPKGALL